MKSEAPRRVRCVATDAERSCFHHLSEAHHAHHFKHAAATAFLALAAPGIASAQFSLSAAAGRSQSPAPMQPAPTVISTQQIDRYDAIKREQAIVAANPKATVDWIILGEIAHEVAMDMPAETAGTYFQMSLNAFTTASALEPENAGLKAAVKFLREQTASVSTFEQSRDTATDTFLTARRRDLAAMKNVPSVRVVNPSPLLPAQASLPRRARLSPPTRTRHAEGRRRSPGRHRFEDRPRYQLLRAVDESERSVVPVAEASKAITPARENAPSTDSANMGMQLDYSDADTSPLYFAGAYRYQPYSPGQGAYSFQEYTTPIIRPAVTRTRPNR